MLDVAKIDVAVPPRRTAEDIQIGALLATCDEHPSIPLGFVNDGCAMRPSYHVTEVKAGQFAALDCGGNPESWSEIFIPL
jgi:hypothetical protein